jgi:hypothetical protein
LVYWSRRVWRRNSPECCHIVAKQRGEIYLTLISLLFLSSKQLVKCQLQTLLDALGLNQIIRFERDRLSQEQITFATDNLGNGLRFDRRLAANRSADDPRLPPASGIGASFFAHCSRVVLSACSGRLFSDQINPRCICVALALHAALLQRGPFRARCVASPP